MIEIRVLITDRVEGLSIQIVSGTNILTDEYFKKRKGMNLKAYLRQIAQKSFDHALEVCLDHWVIKELK